MVKRRYASSVKSEKEIKLFINRSEPKQKAATLADLDPSAKHDHKRLTVTLNEYEARCLELYARKTGFSQAQLFRIAMVNAAKEAIREE